MVGQRAGHLYMHIEIEQMLFGDYRVQVWDDRLSSCLDREYFCRGYASALLCAHEIRTLPGFERLDIYYRSIDKVEMVDQYDRKHKRNHQE